MQGYLSPVTYHLGLGTWDPGEFRDQRDYVTWVDRMLDSEIASNSQLGNWVDRTRDPWIAPGIAGETGTE